MCYVHNGPLMLSSITNSAHTERNTLAHTRQSIGMITRRERVMCDVHKRNDFHFISRYKTASLGICDALPAVTFVNMDAKENTQCSTE